MRLYDFWPSEGRDPPEGWRKLTEQEVKDIPHTFDVNLAVKYTLSVYEKGGARIGIVEYVHRAEEDTDQLLIYLIP